MSDVVTVSLDVHPAIVILPDGRRYDQSRAIIGDGVLHVYVEPANRAEDPPEIWSSDVIATDGNGYNQFSVQTADGDVSIERGSGCGCGSRLKSWAPFQYSYGPVLSPP